MMIDLDRMDELVHGSEPRNIYEESFLQAFTYGFTGRMVNEMFIDMTQEFDKQDWELVVYITFGYGMGQTAHQEALDEIEDLKTNNRLQ